VARQVADDQELRCPSLQVATLQPADRRAVSHVMEF